MLRSFKRKVASAALAGSSLLPQGGKISYLGTQAAKLEPAAVVVAEESAVESAPAAASAAAISAAGGGMTAGKVAGTAAAGAGVAGGGALAVEKGCGKAVTIAESASGAGERSAASAAREMAALERRGLSTAERLGGAEAGELGGLTTAPAGIPEPRVPRIAPVPMVIAKDTGTVARVAVESSGVHVVDSAGREIAPTSFAAIRQKAIIEDQAVKLAQSVLEKLPPGQLESQEQIAAAFKRVERALQADPKFKYEFNVASGNVKIKYLSARGEITGEFNGYSVVKKAGAAGLGYLGVWSYGRSGDPKPKQNTSTQGLRPKAQEGTDRSGSHRAQNSSQPLPNGGAR